MDHAATRNRRAAPFAAADVPESCAAQAGEGLCRGMMLDPADSPEESNW